MDYATRDGERFDLTREPLADAKYIGSLLGIPTKSVLQYARDGRLPCIRIGRHVRFIVADVQRALIDAPQSR
jgi:excisionase family DNA binding protein